LENLVDPHTARAAEAVSARLEAQSNQAHLEEQQQRQRDHLSTRIFILEEEVDELAQAMGLCDKDVGYEHQQLSSLDQAELDVDREVKVFLEQINQRRHALACERATHDAKVRIIEQEKARIGQKLVRGRGQHRF
jgi:hypothetical protein